MNENLRILPLKNSTERTRQQTEALIARVEEDAGIIKRRRIRSRCAFTAAAAVFAAATVGVMAGSAYFSYYHERSVDKYVKDTSSVGTEFEYEALSSENAHFRVTLDKILCDGENAMMIITVDSLDGTSVRDASPYISYSADGRPFMITRGGYAHYEGQEELDGETFSFVEYFFPFEPDELGICREITMSFSQLGVIAEPGEDMYKGISFDVLFEKNVKTADLYDSEGNRLVMSQFGISSDEISVFPDGRDPDIGDGFYYIANDGTKIPHADLSGTYGDGGTLLIFGEIIDTDDYKGIEIYGVEYLKE